MPKKDEALSKIQELEDQIKQLRSDRAKELMAQREAIDEELKALGWMEPEVEGKKRGRQAGSKVKCSICGQEGHTKRTHAKYAK